MGPFIKTQPRGSNRNLGRDRRGCRVLSTSSLVRLSSSIRKKRKMASLSSCNHPGKLCSSFSPSSLKLSWVQRVSVQFIHTQNHTCSLPYAPRALTVISMAPPKPGGGKAKKGIIFTLLFKFGV